MDVDFLVLPIFLLWHTVINHDTPPWEEAALSSDLQTSVKYLLALKDSNISDMEFECYYQNGMFATKNERYGGIRFYEMDIASDDIPPSRDR